MKEEQLDAQKVEFVGGTNIYLRINADTGVQWLAPNFGPTYWGFELVDPTELEAKYQQHKKGEANDIK